MLKTLDQLECEESYDFLVVGAGMVGASAALGLSQLGKKVLLIDAFNFSEKLPDYTPSFDARSTALSWGTREILVALGVWDAVEKHASPIEQVHVSEQGRFGTTRINAGDYNVGALGYVVPNQWLGRCLLEPVLNQSFEGVAIDFLAAAEVVNIASQANGHAVHLKTLSAANTDAEESPSHTSLTERVVTTEMIVIADGTQSSTAKLLGIEYSTERYEQHAIVTNVETSEPHAKVAFERFARGGPLAMLPLTETTCAVVWTHSSATVDEYIQMSDEAFCEALRAVFSDRLGVIERCSQRVAYPLKLVKAKEQCRSGVLLLGNAAHSLHPVAGQGFNLAIRGVAAFLEYVNECRQTERSLGQLSDLRQLCESRQNDQLKTILMSDQLIKIFGAELPILDHGRDLGLVGMDNIPVLKSAFSAQAMGVSGRKARFVSKA